MGFLNTATTITVTAKLTTEGRKRLIEQTNNIFSDFILGDSDANYRTSELLTTGHILANSGNVGENGGINDNIASGIIIHSKLYKGISTTNFTKSVEPNSNAINDSLVNLGETVVSGTNLTYIMIDRNNNTTQFTNLFKSLNLPILLDDRTTFTGKTSAQGGWSNTAFSGFAADRVLLAIINNNSYGELIDGKSIKCTLPLYTGYTSGGVPTGMTNFDIYSTFPATNQWNTEDLDNQYEDKSTIAEGLFGPGPNATYLVSDSIQPPNDNTNLSWSTGYDTFRPFEINNKRLINVNSVPTTGVHRDEAIGFASLDKGVLAFTHPTIVNNIATNFSGDPSTGIATNDLGLYFYTGDTYNVTIDSILNNLVQNIICKANAGEFYKSENETISNGHTPVRISEIGIVAYAQPTDLLAIGKLDRQITKLKNDSVIFDVRIVI